MLVQKSGSWIIFGTSSCYLATSHETDENELEVAVDIISLVQAHPSRILTEQEKYKKAFQVFQNLAQQLSSLGTNEFRERLSVLQTIKSMRKTKRQSRNLMISMKVAISIFKLKSFYSGFVYQLWWKWWPIWWWCILFGYLN